MLGQEFDILSQQTTRFGGVEVAASVIGASHHITYRLGPTILHEVLACVGAGQPSYTLAEVIAMHVIRSLIGSVNYEFTAQLLPWSHPEPTELVQLVAAARIQIGSGGIGIVQEFPQGGLEIAPKTVIVGLPEKPGFVLKTAHSYPGTGLVISCSRLKEAS